MGKVFRIHSSNAAPLKDWSDYSHIDLKSIASQIDTAEGDGSNLPSSIPSPFARIDLVKSAFEKVGDAHSVYDLQGESNHHKLVSDSLDIAEIFFNYSTHEEKLKIVKWSDKDLEKLINSENTSHNLLGKSLSLFMDQDPQYGFKNADSIYILKYNHEVIGATNPSVMFFGAPDSHKLDVKIQFGNDRMLDKEYRSLHLRDINFIKYYVALVYSDLNQFYGLKSYVDRVISEVVNNNPKYLDDLELIKDEPQINYFESTNGLTSLHVGDTGHSPIYLLKNQRIQLFHHTAQINFEEESDFIIQTERISINGLPMVLPNTIFVDNNYKYVRDAWNGRTELPSNYEKTPLNQRKLPIENELYPWISENDIFEDILIHSNLSFDTVNFVTLGDEQFLIPIKPIMLEWFKLETIVKNISLSKVAGKKIEVTLKVPVRGGSIPIKRVYSDPNSSEEFKVQKLSNSSSFGLGIFPFFKSQKKYFISLAHEANLNFEANPIHYKDGKTISTKISSTDRGKSTEFANKIYTCGAFEAIEIKTKIGSNLIAPIFHQPRASSSEKMFCGVDFGTTNTHIEIKKENSLSKPLDFNDTTIVGLLLNGSEPGGQTLNLNCTQTFIDNNFGKSDSEIKTPFRTALLENIVSDIHNKELFEYKNIGFDYEKKRVKDYLTPKTNIKWTGQNEDVELYIKEICHLLLIKSQIENIKPANVYVSWLYPTSMSTHQVLMLKEIWTHEFIELFGNENLQDRLISIPESITPFFNVIRNEEMLFLGEETSVAVDIGGGTTDVMLYEYNSNNSSQSENIKFISSFKFAGNSIFGQGTGNDNINHNGFYSKYFDDLNEQIKKKAKNEVEPVDYNSKSEEFVNFIFSQENLNDEVSLSKMIKNDEHIKLSFVTMYSAIFYHIAELLKKNNIQKVPKYIVFSGTGSKSINFIDNAVNNYAQLGKLAKGVFEHVLGHQFTEVLEIKVPINPKEITSKGAIDILSEDALMFKDFNHIEKIKIVKVGAEEDKDFISLENYGETKGEIRKALCESLKRKTSDFVTMVSKINSDLNFRDQFGVSLDALLIYEKILLEGIDHAIDLELKNKRPEEEINETLFFYSLNNNIPRLVYELSKIKN